MVVLLCGCSTKKKRDDIYGEVLQHQVSCQGTKQCKLLMGKTCSSGGIIHKIDNYFLITYSCNN